MKRTHTEAIGETERIKALHESGVDFIFCQTTTPSGKVLKSVVKQTAYGISAYANKMYRKYGDGVMVEVWYMDPRSTRIVIDSTFCC